MDGLPDYLSRGLDLVFIGMNPGVLSAKRGHYYARRGNHFWRLVSASGLVPEPVTHEDDARMPAWGIGLTDLAPRPTNAASDLQRDELDAGRTVLAKKLRRYRPRVACFNGRVVYESFTGAKMAAFGPQAPFGPTDVFVVPSSSPRVTAYDFAGRLLYFRALHDFVRARCGAGVAAS